jgi:hypothetical protein
MNKIHLLIAAVGILFFNSCQSQKTESMITIDPVFAEADSFTNPYGKAIYIRYDYFLVNGVFKSNEQKQKVKKAIESYTFNHVSKYSDLVQDHILYFYRQSSTLNKEKIFEESKNLRYKVFQDNQSDCLIVTYDFRYFENIQEHPLITYAPIYK